MRRYASQRLLNADTGELLSYQAVELDDGGGVMSISAFAGETAATVWAVGLLVVASSAVKLTSGESFASFRQGNVRPSAARLHAYLITPFDISRMDFTPQSRVVNL